MTGLRALLIGIDDYPDRPLAGCVNDIDAVQELMLERLQVEPSRIRRLAAPRANRRSRSEVPTGEPTRDGILAALGELVASTRPDDRVFLYFAGHGTQLDCTAHGQRFTREAILPVDFDRSGRAAARYVFDWELNSLLRTLATRTPAVSMVFDCCSAGGVARVPREGVERYYPAARWSGDAIPPPDHGARGLGSMIAGPASTGMIVAACLDDETAREIDAPDGTRHGVFTRALLDVLGSIEGDLAELRWSRIWPGLESAVSRASRTQHPWASSSLRRRVFGGPSEPGDAGYALSRSPGTSRVRIHAGVRAGITRGARIAVYGSEPALFPRLDSAADHAARCAVLEVTEAHDGHAEATVDTSQPDRWPEDSRGRLIKAGAPERHRVAIPQGAVDLAQRLGKSEVVAVADDPAQCDVAIERRGDRWVLTDDVHGPGDSPGEPALPACDERDIETAVELVEHHARYTAPLRIARRCADRPGALRVSLLDCSRLAYSLSAAEAQDPALPLLPAGTRAPYELRAGSADGDGGDRFCLRIESCHTESLFVTVLDCDSDGGVTLIADRLHLAAGARATLWHPGGLGQPFRAALSDGQDAGIDRFVFLATTDRAARFDHLELHSTFAAAFPARRISLAPRESLSEPIYTASVVTLRLESEAQGASGHGCARTGKELGGGVAVVIGIDKYSRVAELVNAVNDARAIGDCLEREHHFTVHRCYEDGEATHTKLRTLFEGLANRVGDHERVVIYFAGHGLTRLDDNRLTGNLLPSDGDTDDPDTFVTMAEVRRACEAVAVLPTPSGRKRHVLLLLDCCMAGAAGTRLAVAPGRVLYQERYERLLDQRGVQFIGAAAHHQIAADRIALRRGGEADNADGHSPFTTAVLTALTRAPGDGRGHPVDRNHDGVFLASELYQYVWDELYRWYIRRGLKQKPVYYTFDGHEGGDLVFAASRRATELPRAEKLSARNNPYRGAAAYGDTERDELLMFGRTAAIDSLEQHADAYRTTVVTGRSRSGKSSIVHAGLARRWRAKGLDVHYVEPGDRPPPADRASTMPRLIVVDQLESLSRARAAAFLGELLTLVEQAPLDHVVVIVRAGDDALLDADKRWQVWSVPEMGRDELRAAIEGPADASVLFFDDGSARDVPHALAPALDAPDAIVKKQREPGRRSDGAQNRRLVDTLLDEVEGAPDAISLVSNALHAMVGHQIARGDRFLTPDDHRGIGGLVGPLLKAATALSDAGSTGDKIVLCKLLARLVNVGIDGSARRRVMRVAELRRGDANDEHRLSVLERLERARLVVRGTTGAHADDALHGRWSELATVELVHDALLTGWKVLSELIKNRPKVLRLQQELADASAKWKTPSSTQGLWRSRQLGQLALLAEPRPVVARIAHVLVPSRLLDRIQRGELVALSRDELDFVRSGLRARRSVVIATVTAALFLTVGALAGSSCVKSAMHTAATAEELSSVRAAASMARQSPREIGHAVTQALAAVRSDTEHAPALPQALLELAQQRASLSLPPSCDLDGSIVSASLQEDRLVAAVWRDRKLFAVQGSLAAHDSPVLLAESLGQPVVAVSPRGTWIAYAAEGTLRLWNVRAGRWGGDAMPFEAPSGVSSDSTPHRLAFSGDESRVAVAFGARAINVWDVACHALAMPALALDGNRVLALDRSGTRMIAGAANHVWELSVVDVVDKVDEAHQATPRALDGFDTQAPTTAQFSADGKWLAIGSPAGVGLWSAVGRQLFPRRLSPYLHGNLTALAFSPTSDRLAASTLEGDTMVWMFPGDLFASAPIRHLVTSDEQGTTNHPVSLLLFSGNTVAAAGIGETRVRIWNVGPPLELDLPHGDRVTSLAASSDGRWLVTGAVDRSARVWDLATGELHARLPRSQTVNAVAWHDDWFAAAGDDRGIEIARPDGSRSPLIEIHKSPIGALAIAPTGLVATASGDGTIHVLDDRGAVKLKVEHAPEKPGGKFTPDELDLAVTSVAWSHDGHWLASAGNNRLLKMWSVDPTDPRPTPRTIGQENWHADHGAAIRAVDWSSDDQLVLSAGADGTAKLWRSRDGSPAAVLRHRGAVITGRFARDEGLVVTTSEDATARLWRSTGELVHTFEGHQGPVRDAAFAPSRCKKLATVGDDGTLRLWSTASGRQLASFTAHGGRADHVLFLNDGQDVVTGGADGYVRVFPACTRRILDTLCEMARDQSLGGRPRCSLLRNSATADDDDPCCP